MDPRRLLDDAVAQLRAAGDDEPRKTVSRLVAHVAGCGEWDWMTGRLAALSDRDADAVRDLCRERAAGKPMQYLLGYAWFCGHRFSVGPGVLIPRPDTEILVHEACACAERIYSETRNPIRYTDIGTGSGCVGLSVARWLDEKEIPYKALLTDQSEDALTYTRINRERLAPAGPVQLATCDLYPPEETDTLDLVLSNPPYIPRDVIRRLSPEVSSHEPRRALDGGEDGLDLIRRIAQLATGMLREGGWLLLEHGYDQAAAVTDILTQTQRIVSIQTVRDFGGNERVTSGRLGNMQKDKGGSVHAVRV